MHTNLSQGLDYEGIWNIQEYSYSIHMEYEYSIYGIWNIKYSNNIRKCDNVRISNCSCYHSTLCYYPYQLGGGVGVEYNSTDSYTLDLSHSNMTKCCNSLTPSYFSLSGRYSLYWL